MNSHRFEIFVTVYMKPRRNAWCLVLGQNDMFCQINISLIQEHTGLQFLGAVRDLLSFYMRMAQTQTGMRISRLGPATKTKSDRSEFIVRPVSCKRIKRIAWWLIRTRAGLSSSRSHVNTPSFKRDYFQRNSTQTE